MGEMDDNRPRWSDPTKLVIESLLLALGVYLVYRFRSALTPLVLAVILAYVLTPAVNLIQERLHIRRGLATLLAYLVLLLGAGGIMMGIIPLLANQVSGLNLDIQLFVRGINKFLGRRIYIAGQPFDLEAMFQQAVGALQAAMQPVFGRTLGFAVEVVTSVVWVIFIIVIAFYLIKDYQALREWLENLVPPQYRADYIRLRGEIHYIWSSFFRGQLMLALVVATLFTVIGVVLGLPFSLAMGMFAGLLEFLPSVGHGIWLVTASLLALFVGSSWIPVPNWVFMLVVIGLHLFYQQFDLNYLIPRIIGRSVHLPPLVVILGIVSGAILAGVLGIVLAAPTIASARVVSRYIYANLFDLEPFPAGPDSSLPPPNPRWWRKYFPGK
jgi:predicted PurR-regulated permease PerM